MIVRITLRAGLAVPVLTPGTLPQLPPSTRCRPLQCSELQIASRSPRPSETVLLLRFSSVSFRPVVCRIAFPQPVGVPPR